MSRTILLVALLLLSVACCSGWEIISRTRSLPKWKMSLTPPKYNVESISHNAITNRRRAITNSILLAQPLLWTSRANADQPEKDNDPAITHKVFFDVRISRSDGSFYIRDDLPNTPENTVYSQRLTFGLFGEDSPNTVHKFLQYANATYDPLDERPMPSYGSSTFPALDPATGLVMAGNIPGLSITYITDATALQYRGRVLPAPLWIEKGGGLVHNEPGLLTHRVLDPLPSFGITTLQSGPRLLDKTHVVFGKLLLEDKASRKFFEILQELPTYSMDRPAPSSEETVQDEIADKVFAAQRNVFRGVAKTLGDSRLDSVYPGKFLRRVEVTRVGVL